MFVRVKSTPNSPRRSVQVVESSRVGDKVSQRIVRYVGIALDEAQEAKLRLMGEEFIASETARRLNEGSLFAVDVASLEPAGCAELADSAHLRAPVQPRRPGRPARQTLSSVADPSGVRLADVAEVSRRVEGPHEVLGHLYDYLRFDRVLGDTPGAGRGAALLRDLVIARVMSPDSKRGSARELELNYGKSYPLDALYRLMDSVSERLDDLKRLVFEATASLTGGAVDVMLFDITTLYFESVAIDPQWTDADGVMQDGLRRFGYSKDQKYHCTQVVLALATNEDGLPIGYELFAGNTAEVKTLIACMHSWRQTLQIKEVRFVADRALCSKANLQELEAGLWQYVVAMPLRKSLTQLERSELLRAEQADQAKPYQVQEDLLWVREMQWVDASAKKAGHKLKQADAQADAQADGHAADQAADQPIIKRRLIVTYSAKRAHKDRADRQALIDRLEHKLGKDKQGGKASTSKTSNAKKLISNAGYLKYVEQSDTGGHFILNEDKVHADSAWDGLHAIVTNDWDTPAQELLWRYRRLWLIEDSFRVLKHNLAVRPIYHFKPERIAAHIGICYLAFALMRHAQRRIELAQGAQGAMSIEHIRQTLLSVQSSILEHQTTHAKYKLPSSFSHDASRIYRAFGLKRNLDTTVLQD